MHVEHLFSLSNYIIVFFFLFRITQSRRIFTTKISALPLGCTGKQPTSDSDPSHCPADLKENVRGYHGNIAQPPRNTIRHRRHTFHPHRRTIQHRRSTVHPPRSTVRHHRDTTHPHRNTIQDRRGPTCRNTTQKSYYPLIRKTNHCGHPLSQAFTTMIINLDSSRPSRLNTTAMLLKDAPGG